MNTTNNATKVSKGDAALVFVGGATGTFIRYSTQTFFFGDAVIVTFVINLIGTFALGLSNGLLDRVDKETQARRLRLLIGTGICGGFTTYSLFALELQTLSNLWALTSVPLGVLLYVAGYQMGRP